ncbi:MAG: MarR family transcriptional regulator [Bacteroidota bacterium]
MSIEEDIKQEQFKSEFSKAVVNIIYTHGWLHQHHQELFKRHGLTTPQFNILRILRGQYPSASTVNLLIDRMLDKSSNASRIVDRLETKGLVIRKQCPTDRRAVDVFISEEGLELLELMDNEMGRWETDYCALNEADAKELNRLLDKMRSAITAPEDTP